MNQNMLTVTVGTEINKKIESKKSKRLAKKAFYAYQNGKNSLFFGLSGRLLWFIYYVHPVFFNLIIYLKRKIIKFPTYLFRLISIL